MKRWKTTGIALASFVVGVISCWAVMALIVGNVWWWQLLSTCAATERQNSKFAQAVIQDDLDAASEALSNGANPNGMYHLHGWAIDRLLYWPPKPEGAAWGQRLGEIAILSENPQMVQLLVDAGYDPMWSNDAADSLQLAVTKGNTEITRILLDSGTNPDICNYKGSTPLMLAAALGQVEIMEALLSAGAAPNARNVGSDDIKGYAWITPIFYAVIGSKRAAELGGDQSEAVRMLIRYGAEINDKAKDGSTPLHAAVAQQNLDIVSLLLELGANPSATDNAGRTPYDLALELKAPALGKLLCKRQLENAAD